MALSNCLTKWPSTWEHKPLLGRERHQEAPTQASAHIGAAARSNVISKVLTEMKGVWDGP